MLAEARSVAQAKRASAQRVPELLARRKAEAEAAPAPPRQPRILDPIALKRERSRLIENPVQYAEIGRIIGLPVIEDMTPEEVEEFNSSHLLRQAYLDNWRMWGLQCSAIKAYEKWGGLFAPIGVGWGKTLICQAIAEAAFRKGLKRILLLVPSQVLHQLVKSDFPFARKRIPISYPIHVLGGKTMSARRALAKSGKRGLYILPYSCLSLKDTVENLEAIRPELIIADEADALGNKRAARTKRLMDYVRDHEPQGCVLSGTITSKSIKDYWHLIKWCLGDNCPLPLSANLASDWATKIDAQACSSDGTGPIAPLVDWALDNFPGQEITEDTAGFRLAYKLRLKSCPGVVASGDADIGPSLILNNLPVVKFEASDGWAELERLRSQVVDSWLTPNGDEIEHAIHTYKWLYELSAGFYNELTFPATASFAEREEISESAALEIMELARASHAAQQTYHSELRSWIESNGRHQLDTPMLVGLDMSKHGPRNVGHDLFSLWKDHKEFEADLSGLMVSHRAHGGSAKELQKRVARSLRDSRIVRVCPYKIDHAVQWARSLKGGAIVWVWHQGIGQWLVEALRAADLDPLHCPAGDQHNESILDPANQGRVIVASMKAHGTGKNLQAFSQQLFLQWPRNAKTAEQTLGRMHRNGQEASEVWANTCTTSEFDQLCFAATLNDSLYIHQTTGNRQKLIYATYSPKLPKVFPSAVLRERGFQNKRLTSEQQQLMQERFSDDS